MTEALPVRRRQVFDIAWPIVLSNLATPLLGLVDTAVIGNLGDASLLGAIAIGAVIFSFLYWGFGFLRMGTTALVAQAFGAKKSLEVSAVFFRASMIAVAVGVLLMAFKVPLSALAFGLMDGSSAVEQYGEAYFDIRILGAPFSLTLLVIMGYLLGVQATRSVLMLNILLNGTNILLDLVFVMGFGWDVRGVALATVLAEILTVAVGLWLIAGRLKLAGAVNRSTLFDIQQMQRMLLVNRDIMIRTLCLIFAFAWFTNEGATQGDVVLAANAILMQFVSFAAFFLDGFALAAETTVGAAVGARASPQARRAIRYVFELGGATALLLSAAFFLGGHWVIFLLTNVSEVRETAQTYLFWAIAAPIVSVWCYLLDGIFIGATRTVEMRNAMIASLIAFLVAWWLLVPAFSNHGLWAALHVYFVARALSLACYWGRLMGFAPRSADGLH